MARNYRVLIPNGLTFLSLLSGTCAILVAAATPTAADAPRHLWAAGLLILVWLVATLAELSRKGGW